MSGLFSRETRERIALRPGELRIVLLAATYFFVVLAAWFLVRPVREQLGIAGGVWDLPWLFLVTWAVMLLLQPLYGRAVSVLPRRVFLPLVYIIAAVSFLLFFVGMLTLGGRSQVLVGRAFYVWSSVVNLWVVAVFWSFMADHFGSDRAKRLYPWIAVGGTLGAIAGGLGVRGALGLARHVGGDDAADATVPWLLLASAALFLLVPLLVRHLRRVLVREGDALGLRGTDDLPPIGGAAWAGLRELFTTPYLLRIGAIALAYSLTSTTLYFAQAEIVAGSSAPEAERTELFALIDLLAQCLTLLVQVFLTRRFVASLGIGWTLAILPLVTLLSLVAVWLLPVFVTIAVAQGLRRATAYAVNKPTREVLFSVLEREEKYKAKAAIDTFVYRTGDALGALSRMGLRVVAPGVATVAWFGVPIALAWVVVARRLGRDHAARSRDEQANGGVQGDEPPAPGYSPPPPASA